MDLKRLMCALCFDAPTDEIESIRYEAHALVQERDKLKAENERLRGVLESILGWCFPGMNWTDEIAQALLKNAKAALEEK